MEGTDNENSAKVLTKGHWNLRKSRQKDGFNYSKDNSSSNISEDDEVHKIISKKKISKNKRRKIGSREITDKEENELVENLTSLVQLNSLKNDSLDKQTEKTALTEFFAFHLGRFSTDCSYWQRLESTSWVIEGIYRQMMPLLLPGEEQSIWELHSKNSQPFFVDGDGVIVKHKKQIMELVEACYNILSKKMAGVVYFSGTLDSWGTVNKKIQHYKYAMESYLTYKSSKNESLINIDIPTRHREIKFILSPVPQTNFTIPDLKLLFKKQISIESETKQKPPAKESELEDQTSTTSKKKLKRIDNSKNVKQARPNSAATKKMERAKQGPNKKKRARGFNGGKSISKKKPNLTAIKIVTKKSSVGDSASTKEINLGSEKHNTKKIESVPPSSSQPLIFSGKTKQYDLAARELFPSIIVESFSDKAGKPIQGPKGNFGDAYINNNFGCADLCKVIIVLIASRFCYCFLDAHIRHHGVLPQEDKKKYMHQLIENSIALKHYGKTSNDIKILADNGLTNNLHGGNKHEADLIFCPSEGEIYDTYFKHAKFDLDYLNNYFDNKNHNKNKVKGEYYKSRGEYDVIDIGGGRDGVQEPATKSQQRDGDGVVSSKPYFINSQLDDIYKCVGDISDIAQSFCDDHVFDEGVSIMNDPIRDSEFTEKLREKTGAKKSRFESFTIARQLLGSIKDIEEGKTKFQPTLRHLDSYNDYRKGFRHTFVWTVHGIWEGNVYRYTVIFYNRKSFGDWLPRNEQGLNLVQLVNDYKIEYNGGLSYDNDSFYISDDMKDFYAVSEFDKHKNKKYKLRPPSKDTDSGFYNRQQTIGSIITEMNRDKKKSKNNNNNEQEPKEIKPKDSFWFENECLNDPLTWESFKYKDHNKFYEGTKMVLLAPMANRYGYVSSYASAINQLNDAKNLTRTQKVELVYAALTCPSQILFWTVLNKMKGGEESLCNKNLFIQFCKICCEENVFPGGGPHTRVQPQPKVNHSLYRAGYNFDEKMTLRVNACEASAVKFINREISLLEKGIKELDDGDLLTAGEGGGWLKRNGPMDMCGLGEISLISFPSLCVFTGLATSKYAFSSAKQAMPNCNGNNGTGSTNSYWEKLKKYLHVERDDVTFTKSKCLFLFNAVAQKCGTVIGAIENVCCETFRGGKVEAYFYGQDLYNISDRQTHTEALKVKKFGHKQWQQVNSN